MNITNKQLIQDLYRRVFGQNDEEFANKVIADNYIQHNPMVKTGKAGFMEFLAMLKQLPKPSSTTKPFMRFISEGNLVAVHSQINFMGKDNAVVDLYRVENGLITEHWDAVQIIVDEKPKVKGTIAIDNQSDSIKNKQIVSRFIKQIIIEKQMNEFDKFCDANIPKTDFDIKHDKFQLHRLIGEYDFVVTQSELQIATERKVQYDIYRLSSEKISEHWRVKQSIPKQMAHDNDMV